MSSINKSDSGFEHIVEERFAGFVPEETKPIKEEPLFVEQATSFTNLEPVTIAAVSSFEEENLHASLKPEHAEIVDIPQDSKPEYVEPLIVKPVDEKLDQTSKDLFSEEKSMNIVQSEQNPIIPGASL
ncbi:hypothetical protein BLA29_007823 [Euroglyphus maynei]|uniref:Uncharacterized protein n=1 Tax=Euroglyphus maynei TaxID=6958 RepID=A0A1Y3B1H2_EURMA|nr:hypothetical protein BLA29_007823 [Euroglyphus maynei]